MYDFADEAAMCNEIIPIKLLTVMNEVPTLTIPDINDCKYNWVEWGQQLTRAFEWWLENWINDNLQEHEVKKITLIINYNMMSHCLLRGC